MTKPSIPLQDLQRRIYTKAKAAPTWRFWGLYVHICKLETLRAAYQEAKANNGAPGNDGVTCAAIEASGVEPFLEQLRDELVTREYRPMRPRRQAIPKDGDKVRVLSIPTPASYCTSYNTASGFSCGLRILEESRTQVRMASFVSSSRVIQYGEPLLRRRALSTPRSIQ